MAAPHGRSGVAPAAPEVAKRERRTTRNQTTRGDAGQNRLQALRRLVFVLKPVCRLGSPGIGPAVRMSIGIAPLAAPRDARNTIRGSVAYTLPVVACIDLGPHI